MVFKEQLYINDIVDDNCSFSSLNRNFLFSSDFYNLKNQEKLAEINEKKGRCGEFSKEYVETASLNVVNFPVYCDNRSCSVCVEHKRYKFNKAHNIQIDALNKSMKKPKAWVFTGFNKKFKDLSEARKFCQDLLLKCYHLVSRYSKSECSVHMEIKPKNDGGFYVHFHVVSASIDRLRLVQKIWNRVIHYEVALNKIGIGFYVSKYASKVPDFYSNFQENYYTLLVYKLQMHRFSPKASVGVVDLTYNELEYVKSIPDFVVPNVRDVWLKNFRKKKREVDKLKPMPNYYLVENLEREVYRELRKTKFLKNGSRNGFNPFLENYEERIKKHNKKITLDDFYE
jgi:hypothetical protein